MNQPKVISVSKLNMNSEIKKIEKRLEQAIKSEDKVLEEAAFHLFSSGGKRVRPAVAILSSQFGKEMNEDVYRVAVALELIHMATLVHDDVIDKSDKRRGRLTIAKKWNQSTAILTGNFLLALGLEHISDIEDNRVHTIISNSIIDVCMGELFQFQDQFNGHQSITNYLRRINRKTALLIQLSTEVGAIASGADIKTVHNLKMIGHYIGMSFQIVDDILDFTSTEKQLGKPVGSDLMNGHITLPVLLEMKKNSAFKQQIQQLSPNSSPETFKYCIDTVRSSDVIQQWRDHASLR
jgi:heptaprenyl diphosphate synthase